MNKAIDALLIDILERVASMRESLAESYEDSTSELELQLTGKLHQSVVELQRTLILTTIQF